MAIRLLIIILISVIPGSALAQAIPGPADPGRIEERFSKPPAPPTSPEALKKRPKAEKLPVPEEFKDIKFILKNIMIEGATAYPISKFLPLYADKLDKETSLADIYSVAEKITEIYVNDGYVLSKAFPPRQSIKNGVVHIKIIEAKIRKTTFSGKIQPSYLVERIGKKISSGLLNIKTLEKHMLLMNDLSGVKASAVLKGTEDDIEGIEIAIELTREKSRNSIQFDNFGSRFTGPFEGSYGIDINNITGFYDQLSLNVSAAAQTDELKYLQSTYRLPVTSKGTSLSLSASASKTAPGDSLRDSEIRSSGRNLSIGIFQPIIRSRQENLSISSEFSIKNTSVDTLGVLFYEDKLRIWSISGSYDFVDKFMGSNLINITVSQGVDVLGAKKTGSINLSRAKGHSDFRKASGIASRLQKLNNDYYLYMAATGQLSAHPLLSSEEFGYGGQQFGRAYNSSEITGKDGIAGLVEIRYTGASEINKTSTQPFLFYDIGKVWDINGSNTAASAASAGFGVRLARKHLSGSLYFAQPLTKPVNNPIYGNGKNPSILFLLKAEF